MTGQRLSPDQFRIGKGRVERWGYIDRLGPCDLVPEADPAHPFEAPAWSTIKKAFPNSALPRWKDGMSAEHFYRNAESLLQLPVDEASMKVKNAVAGISTEAAFRGTTAHAVMEVVANGENPLFMLNPEVLPYVTSMKNFLEDIQPEFLLSEFVVFNRSIGYGATADGTAYIPELGGLASFDYKTRKPSVRAPKAYDEEALQVVAAANAEYRMALNEGGEIARAPIPEVGGGLVILFFPDGIYELVIVEVNMLKAEGITSVDEVRALRRFYDTFATNAKRLHGLWQPASKAERLARYASAPVATVPPVVDALLAPPTAILPSPSAVPATVPPLSPEALLPTTPSPVASSVPAQSAPDTGAGTTAEPERSTQAPPSPSLPDWVTQTVPQPVAPAGLWPPNRGDTSPFPFERNGLIERIKKIIEVPEAGVMLAPFPHGVWPMNVPPFSAADYVHTDAELEKIHNALAQVEASFRVPFVDIPEPTPEQIAMVERAFAVDPLMDLETCPVCLRPYISPTSCASCAGRKAPPPVHSYTSVEEVQQARDELKESAKALLEEKGVAEREVVLAPLGVREALAQVGADEQQGEAIAAYANVDPLKTMTNLDVQRIVTVCMALMANELILNDSPTTGETSIYHDGGELVEKLVKQYGGRRPLLDAAKVTCAAHGLQVPKSANAVGSDGLLVALLLHPPTP